MAAASAVYGWLLICLLF